MHAPQRRCRTPLTFSRLSVIALSDAADGKIFVQVRPVEAKGRQLDLVQLSRGGVGETRILECGKTKLCATLQDNKNNAVPRTRGARCVNQGAHASCGDKLPVRLGKFLRSRQLPHFQAQGFAQLDALLDLEHRLTAAIANVDMDRAMFIAVKEKPISVLFEIFGAAQLSSDFRTECDHFVSWFLHRGEKYMRDAGFEPPPASLREALRARCDSLIVSRGD